MSSKQSLFLTFTCLNLMTFSFATSADDIDIEALDASHRSKLSGQKVFQIDGLKGVTILAGADVKLIKSTEECNQFPRFRSEGSVISIIANSQRLNELEISYVNGYFRVEGLGAAQGSVDSTLQIRIYVDDIESIEMGQNNRQKLTISLGQNSKMLIGNITAHDVNIDMQGHGSLIVGELRSESLRINLDGHGKLNFPQVHTESMDVTMNGHGEIELNGSVYTQKVSMSGHGNYNAANLDSIQAALYVRGHAKTNLSVSGGLNLDVDNTDNVRYLGNPLITRSAEELRLSAL